MLELIVLAGGCFWGVEDLLQKIPGVTSTQVGYSGGEIAAPVYEKVKTGQSGHAEAVEIKFDAKVLPLEVLLREHFFKFHDPTTRDRQGNDIGSQYRSVIFYTTEAQKSVALKVIAELDKKYSWPKPIVTEVVPLEKFWPAEEYHQKYLVKHPHGYTCHFYRK